jgi:hypothetical protein
MANAAEGDTGVGAANPRIASQMPIEQRRKASRIRGSKPPDSASGVFRIMLSAHECQKFFRQTQYKYKQMGATLRDTFLAWRSWQIDIRRSLILALTCCEHYAGILVW